MYIYIFSHKNEKTKYVNKWLRII